ncbi:YidC/Oxa1 family membrane protein insertase [Compostimonas suwonensis]|uniref:Membrane protein insertase YidC n=1 Tax=Compostimonas suwonensis TaxID=1048394 RepID=A0A2M9BZN4_9MICO|nr:YidC/Oxa1 family membrane protein insertase [Compostimonas suwonensis]PJJ63545.1 YidC/Oxa1 family membrane protein insertase [Compostimonas suwonensis]
MDLFSFGPIAAIVDAGYFVVSTLSDLLQPLVGEPSAALAVVLLTMLVRAALIPVSIAQHRSQLAMARISPKLRELQKKHRSNPERLQRETMALYAAEKANPLSGCLPMLIQIPVVSIVYAVFTHATINGHANDLLTHTLGGVPLGQSFLSLISGGGILTPQALVFAGILLLILTVSLATRRYLMRPVQPVAPAAPDAAGAPAGAGPLAGIDPARLTAVLGWLPLLTVVFAAFVPLAATIYIATSTSWTLVERLLLRRILGHPGAAPLAVLG